MPCVFTKEIFAGLYILYLLDSSFFGISLMGVSGDLCKDANGLRMVSSMVDTMRVETIFLDCFILFISVLFILCSI